MSIAHSKNAGTSTGDSGTSAPPSGIPTWTTYLTSIIDNKTNTTATVQEMCTYGTTRVFYLEENCPHCFSTLYNNDGEVLCHPHNDIAGECPDFFDRDRRGRNCTPL